MIKTTPTTLVICFIISLYFNCKCSNANTVKRTSISNDDSVLSSKIQEFHRSCPSAMDMIASAGVIVRKVDGEQQLQNQQKHIGQYHDTSKFGWGGWRQNSNAVYTCKDISDNCGVWSTIGECENNPRYMFHFCPYTCNACMEDTFDENFGGTSLVRGKNNNKETRQMIELSRSYYQNEVLVKPIYSMVRKSCKNHDNLCFSWAATGECTENSDFMNNNCALACRSCLHLDYIYRCPIDNSKDMLQPKELNLLFERITSIPDFSKYGNVALSKPFSSTSNEVDVVEDPWLLQFDDFLSSKECDQFLNHASRIGFNKEENTWCDVECTTDDVVQRVITKISKIIGIPSQSFETMHFSKHEAGRTSYPLRHDCIDHHDEKQYGPRILSFYVFLNDVVEGGGKKFPYINNVNNNGQAVVTPKKGRAVLWSNVLNSDLNSKIGNMVHEGIEVKKGIEYGMDIWIHLRDFQTPVGNGCD